MNSRLQTFLDIEQLSPAQLALQLGIQRSGISHILSGRNKPSFEFINSLLRKYPNINAEWLITGVGKPLKNDSTPIPTLPFTLDDTPQTTLVQNNIKSLDTRDVSPATEKKIERITVFYSDGTFDEFKHQ